MDYGVISVRYARALLKSATELKVEEKVYADMIMLAACYVEVADLRATIENPMLLRSEKVRLLTTALGPDANELSKRFIELVLKEGREKVLQFMANSYITFYREQKNIIRGKLTTAAAVSEATEQKMKQMVESRTQGTVEFNTEVDPSIIGGFILEYDTYRMDASVKTRLNNILSELK
ncbi:MAG: F0F1 ATP synthase subunit delta [Prevotella sp.]|jgi:F-type H+-transporting ATPase subunit delta|nr:F0F1 ATP synthase subunit delta [Prevotella sp.]